MPNDAEGSVLGTGNPEAGETTWNSGLTDYDELVTAKGWSGPGDVLESYVNLEKAVGADKVVLPLADTDLADWDGWSKLGTPDEPDGYELNAPEGMEQYDQGLSDWFREAAHSAKMPATMAQAMHDKFVERMGGSLQEQSTNQQAQQETWEGELRKEYGTAFDERVAAARSAIREFGSPELQGALESSGLGSNPEFVKAFAKIGMALGKGPQFKEAEGSGRFGTTPDMAKEQIASIRANPALYDEGHAEFRVLNDKLTQLNQLAYGDDLIR
tara:strand:+ start:2357 stop:3169 length:813 start_codon:yes stop_codon:yes gene_type:complete